MSKRSRRSPPAERRRRKAFGRRNKPGRTSRDSIFQTIVKGWRSMWSRSSKKIVISFDWHNDRNYRNLLAAWLKNPNFNVDFDDLTPGAIDTDDVGRVKAVLTSKIRSATHTLVLIGEHANDTHPDSKEIGTRNWIWWEIEKSKAEGKKLIAVKIMSTNQTPDPLYGSGATWAVSFTESEVQKAIDKA